MASPMLDFHRSISSSLRLAVQRSNRRGDVFTHKKNPPKSVGHMAPVKSDDKEFSYDEGEISDFKKKYEDEGDESYSHYDALDHKFDLGDDFVDDETDYGETLPVAKIVMLVLLVLVVCVLFLKRDDMMRAWRMRQAARAARALGKDEELKPVDSWFGTTKPVRVMITMDGQTHTIGADASSIMSISQLPFVLTDACAESGFPELSGVSIVDLCIAKQAELRYEAKDGISRPVDGQTTPWDLQTAKALRVNVEGKQEL